MQNENSKIQEFNSQGYLLSEIQNQKEKLLCNIQIKSFQPKDQPDLVEKLKNYQKTNYGGLNYTIKRLNFDQQEVITVFLKKGKLKGFCTAWNRKSYPSHSVRILNRFWLDHSIRRKGGTVELLKPHAFLSVEHQCFILKSKGFEWVFISRPFGYEKWCRTVTEILNKKSIFKKWCTTRDLFCVCPDVNDPSCWQLLIFTKLNTDSNTSDFGLLKHRLSKGEFIEKFKKKK